MTAAAAGELFVGEIREQPQALIRLLEHEAEFSAVARAVAGRRPSVVRLVGHGTSDAAASYGVYAFGLLAGLTAIRDSISLVVYYDAPLDLSDAVVLGLSQSGETPDVIGELLDGAGASEQEVSGATAQAPAQGLEVRLWDPSSQLRFRAKQSVPPRPDGAPNRVPAGWGD